MKIVLIGMPTSGKSTVSKLFELPIIDIDALLEKKFNCSLQKFIEDHDEQEFLNEENQLLLEYDYPDNCVISTGGSAVYATDAMEFFKNSRMTVVYLQVSLPELEARLSDQRNKRGIIMNSAETWEELLDDRHELYVKYADIIVDTDNKTPYNVFRIITDNIISKFMEP